MIKLLKFERSYCGPKQEKDTYIYPPNMNKINSKDHQILVSHKRAF